MAGKKRNPYLDKLKSLSFPARDSSWTSGVRYCPSLADKPNDPDAWVSSPHQAREVARRKGLVITDIAR